MAVTNIIRNGRFYIPYYLSCILTTAMFYNMSALEASDNLPGGETRAFILRLGIFVIGFFSVIFLFYTNSFLLRRRKKEFGLYNILGMEKRHIARLMFWETLISAALCILIGVALGLLMDRLLCLVLLNVMKIKTEIAFRIQVKPLTLTVAFFAVLYFVILLWNMRHVVVSKPIELLQGGNVGEKEPKAKWVLAVLGLICLAGGYIISLTTKNIVVAIFVFFVAVILVIIGTYLSFTVGSIAILKLLRKNRSYYYKPKHFVSVSGMFYRMKQHAVGLGNICILSTMVLVMVSTTASLYMGIEDIINIRCPRDICITQWADMREDIETMISDICKELDIEMENYVSYDYLDVAFAQYGDDEFVCEPYSNSSAASFCSITFLRQNAYRYIYGEESDLGDDEVMLYGKVPDTFTLGGRELHTVKRLEQKKALGAMSAMITDGLIMVVSDNTYQYIYDEEVEKYSGDASLEEANFFFDITGDREDAEAFQDEFSDRMYYLIENRDDHEWYPTTVDYRGAASDEAYSIYGSFLFLGLFLGILFMVATVLIIYYKQLIEGYEDRRRFEIMQQVGMDKAEIKRSIKSQILTMFFMPLVTAIVHIAFAFPILTQLLSALQLTNVALFVRCTVVCIAVYAAVYAIVYAVTAKTYYNIVSES